MARSTIIPKDELSYCYLERRLSGKDIANLYGCSPYTIKKYLDEYDIPKRSNKEAQLLHISQNANFNVEFFKKETSDFFYVLGLLATDGDIFNNSIKFTSTDKDLIEWLINTLEYKNKVMETENKRGFYVKKQEISSVSNIIRFKSIEVSEILLKYGITEKKSLTLKFPTMQEEFLPHFIRGVLDGDGCVYITKRNINGKLYDRSTVTFTSGSVDFIYSLKSVIEGKLGGNRKVQKKKKIHENGHVSITYEYRFESKRDVINFTKWVYGTDLSFYGLQRKKDKLTTLLKASSL
jgi:hypothetical protein